MVHFEYLFELEKIERISKPEGKTVKKLISQGPHKT